MTGTSRRQESFPTLAESVADWIGEEVLSGRWQQGRRITEIEVAEQLGVSRQPVREALRMLGDQGLVKIIPRIGAVVGDYNPDFIAQTYRVRAQLESWLVGLAVPRMPDEGVERLGAGVELWIAQSTSPAVDLVAHYDRAWLLRREQMSYSGNEVGVDLAADLRTRLRGFPKVLRRDPTHVAVVGDVLRELHAACARGDATTAGAVIEGYLLGNIDLVGRAFRPDEGVSPAAP